jgi:sugar/nucleoside kinase (ribokinase family)
MSRPRIAVVGVVVQDQIDRADGTTAHGLGGIAYSVAAVAALGGDDVEVVPICRVADDTREAVELEWGRSPNVTAEALIAWDGPGSRVELRYVDAGRVGGDREERLRWPTPPLTADEVEAALECDAILLNCITGAVLTAEALRLVASATVPVHLDVHSLVLGIDAAGRRFPQRPPDWREWLLSADSVQSNEQEAAILAGEEAWSTSSEGFVRGLVDSRIGPRAMTVTRAARGATLYRAGCAPLHVDAPEVAPIDPTGAGDTFGAAFVVDRILGGKTERALRRAVNAASASCLLEGTRELQRLRSLSA